MRSKRAPPASRFNSPRTQAHRDDVCLIAFTSGTTGQPKGTMHFHRDILVMADAFTTHVLKPTRNDVFCGTPPLAFTFGLGGLLAMPLRFGASTVLIEKPTPEALARCDRINARDDLLHGADDVSPNGVAADRFDAQLSISAA